MDDYILVMIIKSLCSMPERLIQQFYEPHWAWVWLKYWWITSGKIVTMSGNCQGNVREFQLEWSVATLNSVLELELQLNSNSGIGIEFGGIENGIGTENPGIGILRLLPQHLLVDQPLPNFSFNRGGHNLSCDWLVMQQVFFKFWDFNIALLFHQRHMGSVPFNSGVDRGQRD